MDLKNILNEVIEDINDNEDYDIEKHLDLEQNPNIKKHKKPIQLKEIERRSKTNLLNNLKTEKEINKFIDDEKNSIYTQTWSRLDNGSKINRIKLFTESILKEKYNLSENEINKCIKLLTTACTKNKLTKNSEVNYNKETTLIEEIKILNFNEEKRIFTLNFTETKSKSKNKSKSNIERFFK